MFGINKHQNSETDPDEVRIANDHSPLAKFTPLGTYYFAYQFPTDNSCLEKEILNRNGIIGPDGYLNMFLKKGAEKDLKKWEEWVKRKEKEAQDIEYSPFRDDLFDPRIERMLIDEKRQTIELQKRMGQVVLNKIKDFDDLWWIDEDNKTARDHLLNDLKILATLYNNSSACTIISALSMEIKERMEWMKRAADMGNINGMVAYGVLLYLQGYYKDGFSWVMKGAKRGEEMGMLFVALSYHYGTFTPHDYDQAVYWYRKLLKKHKNFYAANNLGVIYAEANCMHTAKKYFTIANEIYHEGLKKDKDLVYYSEDYTFDFINNLYTCKRLLHIPYALRPKRIVVKHFSPTLQRIMAKDPVDGSVIPEDTNYEPWANPTNLVSDDKKERKEAERQMQQKARTKVLNTNTEKSSETHRFEDFIFPSYEVTVRNANIFGNQHELVFLEKNAHAELNLFIQKHLAEIRELFKKNGFYFSYLPAHTFDINEMQDIIGTYCSKEFKTDDTMRLYFSNENRNETQYWSSLISQEALPADCAGLLHYIPNAKPGVVSQKYNYYMVSFSPKTDFKRMFQQFAAFIAKKQLVEMESRYGVKNEIVGRPYLLTTNDYHIYITDERFKYGAYDQRDIKNAFIAEVEMHPLSKVLYFLFLRHPEGIILKELVDYKTELLSIYKQISAQWNEQSINNLVDPTKNSANEKISRIRSDFRKVLEPYNCDIEPFVPMGAKGERYKVASVNDTFFLQDVLPNFQQQ